MNSRLLQNLNNEIKNPFYQNSTTTPLNSTGYRLIISDELLKFIRIHGTVNELVITTF
jgi:hypothetical protein